MSSREKLRASKVLIETQAAIVKYILEQDDIINALKKEREQFKERLGTDIFSDNFEKLIQVHNKAIDKAIEMLDEINKELGILFN